MDVQMSVDDLREITKFINNVNKFAAENQNFLSEEFHEMEFEYYDSNGDNLGVVTACDWGEFGFKPNKEIEA